MWSAFAPPAYELPSESEGRFTPFRPKKGGLGVGLGVGRRNAHDMSKHKGKSGSKGSQKTFASKRTINPSSSGHQGAEPNYNGTFQEEDPKRRLGGFETTGEHARTGNRGHQ